MFMTMASMDASGFSRFIRFASSKPLETGDFVRVRITGINDVDLIGEVVK